MTTKTSQPTWSGVVSATDADHDECYRRYIGGCSRLAEYRFEVADDMRSVSITDNPQAANGIWTLAELRADGQSWRGVAAVAAMMRAAIDKARGN